jgi:hypothetical protein
MASLSIVGLVVVAVLAWFVSVDPLKYSMGRGIAEFNPHYIAAPPAEKFKDFPRDTESKLQNAEIMWRGQMLGPESLAFDSQGRGPYTGVSDGRILRYDGPELGWTTFAYTSRNRFALSLLFQIARLAVLWKCSREMLCVCVVDRGRFEDSFMIGFGFVGAGRKRVLLRAPWRRISPMSTCAGVL